MTEEEYDILTKILQRLEKIEHVQGEIITSLLGAILELRAKDPNVISELLKKAKENSQ
jgi:hypothetical protein